MRHRHAQRCALLVALCRAVAGSSAAPDERFDFYDLEKQRAQQGLRMTHYDYPAYGETECKHLIDVQPWSPGGQIPFSCLLDRMKRLYLIAQDIWCIGSESRMKQTALDDDPSPLTAGLQLEEGPEQSPLRAAGGAAQEAESPLRAAGRAAREAESPLRAAGRAAREELMAEAASFLQMHSEAAPGKPVAPINIPQIQKVMRGLLFMLREANEMIDHVKNSNGVAGTP